ncbi:class 1 fructose-bisphosphatase [Actibacterium ureilyticum]|uniref:class 1 fructose-bisphosphatase n=1 Tax=Actibacterium ureilyticum TaxID=1590614 RepID=UPI000BAAA13E|nr:class 1 fructose-bisphosphatase [Actibacterium ureilyticum]
MKAAELPLSPDQIPAGCKPVIDAICHVGRDLAHLIARGPLGGSLGDEVGTNSDGDGQKALDVIADEAFAAALRGTGVRHYASEEREGVVEIDADGTLALAIDPLDGSSNINVNVSIGTIFGIYPAADTPEGSFLRPASEQIGAGYIIYGPQTVLVLTFGDGILSFLLDPITGQFTQSPADMQIPPRSSEYAINASNYRHWSAPVRAYVDDCLAGDAGRHAQNYNMRWIASLVAETHRIMVRGGVFLYPSDARPNYRQGRLRMLYECAPIAFLVEQAGGKATDGQTRILDLGVTALHARCPLIFGSAEPVDRITVYHDLPPTETSALFAERSLFRV